MNKPQYDPGEEIDVDDGEYEKPCNGEETAWEDADEGAEAESK